MRGHFATIVDRCDQDQAAQAYNTRISGTCTSRRDEQYPVLTSHFEWNVTAG